MSFDHILNEVKTYYGNKVTTYGPTAKGVDVNSEDSQFVRFEQLLKVCAIPEAISLNDYGCGYGALVQYLAQKSFRFTYHGFDISEEMIVAAKSLHGHRGNCAFSTDEASLPVSDYTIASGIFNVKLGTGVDEWKAFVLEVLTRIAASSKKGVAFNMLTGYADRDRMRADLYYADPLFFFDYCKRHFSPHVSLLHDYPLYEFTILIRL
jgi:SAM-dependent methyltransferase